LAGQCLSCLHTQELRRHICPITITNRAGAIAAFDKAGKHKLLAAREKPQHAMKLGLLKAGQGLKLIEP